VVLEVQYFNMAIKPISLPSRSLPNLQASAAGGRPFRASRMTPARLFPKQQQEEAITPERQYPYSESYTAGNYQVGPHSLHTGYYEGINRDDRIAAQEEGYYENIEREKRGETPLTQMEIDQTYRDKYKIPDDELTRLRTEARNMSPDASFDSSQGLPEGFSDPSGFAPTNQADLAGKAFAKGEYGKAALHGTQALAASTIGMPASIADAIFGPLISKGYQAVKGALGFGTPANSGSAVPSGTGISGLSGPMGLAHAEAGNLADIGVNPDVGFDGGNMGMGDDGMSSLGEGFE